MADCPSGVLAPQQRADSSCTLSSSLQPLHAADQIGPGSLHQQMIVISHQDPPINSPTCPLTGLTQIVQPTPADPGHPDRWTPDGYPAPPRGKRHLRYPIAIAAASFDVKMKHNIQYSSPDPFSETEAVVATRVGVIAGTLAPSYLLMILEKKVKSLLPFEPRHFRSPRKVGRRVRPMRWAWQTTEANGVYDRLRDGASDSGGKPGEVVPLLRAFDDPQYWDVRGLPRSGPPFFL